VNDIIIPRNNTPLCKVRIPVSTAYLERTRLPVTRWRQLSGKKKWKDHEIDRHHLTDSGNKTSITSTI
jgi:hypothetical protein